MRHLTCSAQLGFPRLTFLGESSFGGEPPAFPSLSNQLQWFLFTGSCNDGMKPLAFQAASNTAMPLPKMVALGNNVRDKEG